MMFRNLQPFELKQLDSLLNTHSYILQNHSGIDLPTEQVPRSYPYHIKPKQETQKQQRINKTLEKYFNSLKQA